VLGGMATFTGQRRQALAHGPVDAFDRGGVEFRTARGHRQQGLGVLYGAQG